MGNATSIFNLMRNIGGSIGIAIMTTFLARRTQVHQNHLVANVTAGTTQTPPASRDASQLHAHGADAVTASHKSSRPFTAWCSSTPPCWPSSKPSG